MGSTKQAERKRVKLISGTVPKKKIIYNIKQMINIGVHGG